MKTKNRDLAEQFIHFAMFFFKTAKSPVECHLNLRANSRSFSVLFALKCHPKKNLTMSQLAQELHMSKQQLTKLVNGLEENGYVRRIPNQENRRQVLVDITPTGAALTEQLLKDIVEMFSQEMTVYSQEEKEEMLRCFCSLNQLLNRMNKNTESSQEPLLH